MEPKSHARYPELVRIRAFIISGSVFALLLLGGSLWFISYHQALRERADDVQFLYKDMLDFRNDLTMIAERLKADDCSPEAVAAVARDARLLQFRTYSFLRRAEKSRLPDIARWLATQQVLLARALNEMESSGNASSDIIRVMTLQLDEVILKTGVELRHVHSDVSSALQQFLLVGLCLLLLFGAGAVSIVAHTYRQTVIPLHQLALKLRRFNKDLPESLHDTVEDVRQYRPGDLSGDISAISDTIVTFCHDLELKNKKLDELFIKDEKTNLYNYRHFKEHLIVDVARARRYGDAVSLAMLDLDHFKTYNDANGHIAGDEVLLRIAEIILEECRSTDIPARFGGEEFAVLFPRTDSQTAHRIIDRLRSVVSAEPFNNRHVQPDGKLTVSAGIACYPSDARDWFDLINNADKALYHAKSTGRNRVFNFQQLAAFSAAE